MARWIAQVPASGFSTEALPALIGMEVDVAAEHLRSVFDEKWDGYRPPEQHEAVSRRGRIMFVTSGPDDTYVITCDDVDPLRYCNRCRKAVDTATWVPDADDHLVMIQGPLTIESVATDERHNTVRFRAEQPYIIIRCSQVDRTLATLRATLSHRD